MPLSWQETVNMYHLAAKVACRFIVRGTLAAYALAYCMGATAAAPALPVVTAGGAHAAIQKTDGSIALWGDNSVGQLGTGARLMSTTPIQVAGVPAASAASAGVGHVLVLAQDGTVWAWGDNTYGQLGDGTQIPRNVPVNVQGLANITQVAAGGLHSLALRKDGTVWAWGLNTAGQVGDGTTTNRAIPVQVQGLGPVVSISAGLNHAVVLQADGRVFAWGDNSQSQIDGLGQGTYPIPHGVEGFGVISSIAASGTTSFAVATNGWVYWWGSMRNHSTGGTPGVSRIQSLTNIATVSGGATATQHVLFIFSSGLVQLYNDSTQTVTGLLGQTAQTFVTVAGLGAPGMQVTAGGDYVDPDITIASPGGAFATMLLTDNTVSSLGLNTFGQLGNSSDQSTPSGVAVPGIGGTVSVASGNAFALAVKSDGTVWIWGDNVYGELGDGTNFGTSVPVTNPALGNATAIAAGYAFDVTLNSDGSVSAWGDNSLGQSGNGTRFAKQSAPAAVIGLAGMTAVAAGMTHGLALDTDHTVWSWGDNATGQLGRATTNSGINGANAGLVGGQITDFVDGMAIAAGDQYSLVLKTDGTVWTWGADLTGQTGCTTFQPPCTVDPTVPRQVAGLANIVQIAAGIDFALALRNDGTVFSFGSDSNGQLGNGFILPQSTQNAATAVKELPPATAIAAGARHALALQANGAVWAWGWNNLGQLGRGNTNDIAVPATVAIATAATAIGAGYATSYATLQGGPLIAWGDNSYAELGDGSYIMRGKPVAVVHEGGTGNIPTNDWFLIPDPTKPVAVAPSLTPNMLVQSLATGPVQAVALNSTLAFLPPDAGGSGSVYVTAMIPPNSLQVLAGLNPPANQQDAQAAPGVSRLFPRQNFQRQATATTSASDYVLAQLTPSGWQIVDNLQLIPLATGIFGTSIATQNIMNGIDTTQLAGAQFCFGYGATGQAMVANQTMRAVLAVNGGPAGVSCIPPSATVEPQSGLWWNPAESGRGYTIEYNGTNLFMAAYLYDVSGRSTWVGAGPSPMNGSTFSGPLQAYMNGQTLTGTYQIPVQGPSPGNISITFTDPTHGMLTWPEGTIPIERFAFVPDGLSLPPTSTQPQTGWWWYSSEGGRGYSIEVQGDSVFIASYMFDTNGNPVWYAAGPAALVNDVYVGEWVSYSGGQTLTGPYQPPTGTAVAGSLTIQFSSPTTGVLTLPDGRSIPIQRFTF
jgi:alpha-tubulin suppressor-like RCC1 family protein